MLPLHQILYQLGKQHQGLDLISLSHLELLQKSGEIFMKQKSVIVQLFICWKIANYSLTYYNKIYTFTSYYLNNFESSKVCAVIVNFFFSFLNLKILS